MTIKTIRLIALLLAALIVSGCPSATVGLLGGLGSTALMSGAAYAGKAISEDTIAAAEFRGRHQMLVDSVVAAMMSHARSLEQTDWDAAVQAYSMALMFSMGNQPQILLRRLRDQFKEVDE